MALKAFGGTDVGCVREHNEDALLLLPEKKLFAVFDGVGGHNAGEVASALAAQTVAEQVTQGVGLADAVREAHRRIRLQALENKDQAGMATTCVALRKGWRGFQLAWVGDSRCYRIELAKKQISALTVDHSFVQEKVDQGVLDREEIAQHPMAGVLTRVLGQPRRPVQVDCAALGRLRGSLLLLCSDGLNAVLEDDEIADICCQFEGQQRIEALISCARERGAPDNVTIITVEPR